VSGLPVRQAIQYRIDCQPVASPMHGLHTPTTISFAGAAEVGRLGPAA
jgi:hypothetical protein